MPEARTPIVYPVDRTRLAPGFIRDLYERGTNELVKLGDEDIVDMSEEIFEEVVPAPVQRELLRMFGEMRKSAEITQEQFARAVARGEMGNPFVEEEETDSDFVRLQSAPGFNREFYRQRLGNFTKWPRETKFWAILRVIRRAG